MRAGTDRTIQIRSLDAMSVGKMTALVSAALLFIIGLMSAALVTMGAGKAGGPVAGFVGLFAVVVYPLMGLVFGFIGGVLTAFAYNVSAAVFGGLEIEL